MNFLCATCMMACHFICDCFECHRSQRKEIYSAIDISIEQCIFKNLCIFWHKFFVFKLKGNSKVYHRVTNQNPFKQTMTTIYQFQKMNNGYIHFVRVYIWMHIYLNFWLWWMFWRIVFDVQYLVKYVHNPFKKISFNIFWNQIAIDIIKSDFFVWRWADTPLREIRYTLFIHVLIK